MQVYISFIKFINLLFSLCSNIVCKCDYNGICAISASANGTATSDLFILKLSHLINIKHNRIIFHCKNFKTTY